MPKPSLILLSLLCIGIAWPSTVEAQFFRRTSSGQSAQCPRGGCPIQAVAQVVAQPVQHAVASSRGHWSYPGHIDDHLREHGFNPNGMTLEQKLDLHDAIHEGRVKVSRAIPTPVAAPPVMESVTQSSNRQFRETLLDVARQARKQGEINSIQYFLIYTKTLNPTVLNDIRTGIEDTLVQDGLHSTAEAMDWSKFWQELMKYLPLILSFFNTK